MLQKKLKLKNGKNGTGPNFDLQKTVFSITFLCAFVTKANYYSLIQHKTSLFHTQYDLFQEKKLCYSEGPFFKFLYITARLRKKLFKI
jgi:hypothetical protein